MRLTAKDHPESIRRFAHIRPVRGGAVCGARWTATEHACTREARHRGPHVAHGRLRRVMAVWDTGREATGSLLPVPSADSSPRAPVGRGRPVGLKAGGERGTLRGLGRTLLRMIVDIEELALLLMFLAFVYFALDWLKIILR